MDKTKEETKKPGRPFHQFTIPEILVTDFDAERADQHQSAQQKSNGINDEEQQQLEQQNGKDCGIHDTEEDLAIFRSLREAHRFNREINVDDMEMGAAGVSNNITDVVEYSAWNTWTNASEPKIRRILPSKCYTDDELADMEVSRLTSSLERERSSKSVPKLVENLKRPTANFVQQPPPGALPNVSDVVSLSQNKPLPSFDDDFYIQKFLPLSDMFAFHNARMDEGIYIPSTSEEATRKSNLARMARLNGENGHAKVPSNRFVANDELPPNHWHLFSNDSTNKSDGGSGSKDEMNDILETFEVIPHAPVTGDNSSTAPNDVPKSSSPSQEQD